jgi:hypothetical protein
LQRFAERPEDANLEEVFFRATADAPPVVALAPPPPPPPAPTPGK